MMALWRLFLVMLMLAWAGNAHASVDSSCYPDWKLKQTDYNGCSSTGLLSPGNDTRVNLLMLLHDRHGAVGPASKYASYIPRRRGEAEPFDWAGFAYRLGPSPADADDEKAGTFPLGTRCMSNMTGSAEFVDEVARAKGLSVEERATLTAVRVGLNPQCSDAKAAVVTRNALTLVKSKTARAFADYLIGAAAFYDGSYDDADMAFARVGKNAPTWPREAASYMQGRVALQQAMLAALDEYGGLAENGSEPGMLDKAYKVFQAYLQGYPSGRYAASARGLLRRVYWLGRDHERLAREYAALFRQPMAEGRSFPDLVQEIDVKLLGELKPADVADPMLLAVLNLRAMRRRDDPKFADYGTPPMTRAALDAQRSKFAGNEVLFGYLQAVHAFYVADKPADVLRLIPANMADSGYLGHSRQLLRALALDAIGDAGARPALAALVVAARKPHQRGAAELALAMHDEHAKAVNRIFASNSAIRDPDIREILLRYHAGQALLRQRAKTAGSERERRVAIFTLLYKDLTRGAYGDFLSDSALVPTGTRPYAEADYEAPRYTDIALFNWAGSRDFVCPSLKAVAMALSVNSDDARGLLCLGEFIRNNGLDPAYNGVTQYLDENPAADELGGSQSLFAGKRFSRLNAYKAVMANAATAPENRAYALYRAVHCYAPSGYNGCDATEVTKAQRKIWFEQLKGQYPTSVWAKKLQYYW